MSERDSYLQTWITHTQTYLRRTKQIPISSVNDWFLFHFVWIWFWFVIWPDWADMFWVPAPLRCHAFVVFCILYTFLCLRHTLGVGLGGGVWANNVLVLAYLVDATSQEHLENSCYAILLSLVITSYTTSSFVNLSLRWCYVTRTSLDCMLRYVAFSCISYTTSSYIKLSLRWCCVTTTSWEFMLCYAAFSCTSSPTSSFVKLSLRW